MQTLAEEVEGQIVPKYKNYYVSYMQLFESIKLLKQREEGTETSAGSLIKGLMLPKDFTFGDTTAMFGFVEQRPEVRFVSLLQHEVSKLNHFSQLEVKTILSTLKQLERKLSRILSNESAEPALSRRAFPSMMDESELSLNKEEKLRTAFERLMSIADELLVLDHYVNLNIVILKRVVDEFDREFSPPVGSWFVSSLTSEPFANVPFKGLFTIIARLCEKCDKREAQLGGSERAFSVSPSMTLRAKLLLVSIADLQRPLTAPESLWTSFHIPLRSEDLSHESMASFAPKVHVVMTESDSSGITSIDFPMGSDRISVEWKDKNLGSTQMTVEELVTIVPETHVTISQYDETVFSNARLVENIRMRTGRFSFQEAFTKDTVDINRGFDVYDDSSRFDAISCNVVFISSESVQSRLCDIVSPLSSPFTMNDLKKLTPVPSPVTFERLSSLHTPPVLPAPVPLLPVTSSGLSYSSPALRSISKPGDTGALIYPKNYMANERSLLAWISATSVQSGIGLALLGKEGLSFMGAILCLISLVFLWWSVFMFVKRFHQMRNPKPENSCVFYSMEQCTVFGLTQLVLLLIQSLVFIWTS